MLKTIFEILIKKIKKNNFTFDPNIQSKDLFFVFWDCLKKYFRGVFIYRRFIMVGKNCTLYKVKFGKGVNINHNVTINGIGKKAIYLGNNVSIGSFSLLKTSGSLQTLGKGIYIGDNVGIGEFAHIGGAGGVKIGDNTIIGSYFSVHPENHIFSDLHILIKEQGVSHKGISIGSNCWIGAKVTILDGSVIGNGCIIAAGAVVNTTFPDNVVLAGIPAKIIKRRDL